MDWKAKGVRMTLLVIAAILVIGSGFAITLGSPLLAVATGLAVVAWVLRLWVVTTRL
jgi:hypothetical protein